MPTLNIEAKYTLAPVATQMKRFDKGAEQFYYAMLFSSQPYAARQDAWRSWLSMGFHVGSHGYPPGAAVTDRLVLSERPDGKVFVIKAASSNKEALRRLQEFLQEIDKLRMSLQGKDDDARAKELEANRTVRQALLTPMMNALKKQEFRPDEIESFSAMVRRGLIALTDEEISTLRFSLN